MIVRRILIITTAVLALAVALSPYQAWAPVAPRDCGMLEAKGKRFNIKADQVRCRAARRAARRYIVYRIRPRGYSCRTYSGGTSIAFRCSRGDKVIFAIRR